MKTEETNNDNPTLQTETDRPGDLRSAQEKAMTSHLEGFPIRNIDRADLVDEDSGQIDIGPIDLPDTAKGCYELMQAILETPAEDPRDEDVKKKKLSVIRSHLHTLEQGEPTPVIPSQYHIEASRLATSDMVRLQELAAAHPEISIIAGRRLKSAGFSLQSASAPALRTRSTVKADREERCWSRVRQEIGPVAEECAKAFAAQRSLCEKFRAKSMFPEQAKMDCKLLEAALLPYCEIDEIETLVEVITKLRGFDALPAVTFEARRRNNSAFFELREKVEAMATAAHESLEKQYAELVKLEADFFKSSGVPAADQTSVSKIVPVLKEKLDLAVRVYLRLFDFLHSNPTSDSWGRADSDTFAFLFPQISPAGARVETGAS